MVLFSLLVMVYRDSVPLLVILLDCHSLSLFPSDNTNTAGPAPLSASRYFFCRYVSNIELYLVSTVICNSNAVSLSKQSIELFVKTMLTMLHTGKNTHRPSLNHKVCLFCKSRWFSQRVPVSQNANRKAF